MTGLLHKLCDSDLREIAAALRSGRLMPPYSAFALQRILPAAASVSSDLNALAETGLGPDQLASALTLLLTDRHARPQMDDQIELVTTGPEVSGVANRDTSVVVRELFANARESVLVAGYAVYQGQRVFQALADRMLEIPTLQVKMFLDVQRPPGDTSMSAEIVRRFAERLRSKEWPRDRPFPQVYFDPRSVELDRKERASLHAKCIVVDQRTVFVSSANFTEAAQKRNLEIGLLIRSRTLAGQLIGYFEELLAREHLIRAPI
jgi:phosphatidylserine/phosphatidylglycerophosphate/cardiolipin synthase-like enzyme